MSSPPFTVFFEAHIQARRQTSLLHLPSSDLRLHQSTLHPISLLRPPSPKTKPAPASIIQNQTSSGHPSPKQPSTDPPIARPSFRSYVDPPIARCPPPCLLRRISLLPEIATMLALHGRCARTELSSPAPRAHEQHFRTSPPPSSFSERKPPMELPPTSGSSSPCSRA